MMKLFWIVVTLAVLMGCSTDPVEVPKPKPGPDTIPTRDTIPEPQDTIPRLGPDGSIYATCFVTDYIVAKNIRLESPMDDEPYLNDPLSLRLRNNTNGAEYYDYLSLYFNPWKKRKFDELCAKNGDTAFNRVVYYRDGNIPFPTYGSRNWTRVKLTSDADYDEEHPAWLSLGDIVTYYSMTPAPYIRSGYTDTYDWKEYPEDGQLLNYCWMYRYAYDDWDMNAMHPVEKHLDELTPDDLILNGFGRFGLISYYFAYLRFDHAPTLAKTHTFTLEMIADDGDRFLASKKVTFP